MCGVFFTRNPIPKLPSVNELQTIKVGEENSFRSHEIFFLSTIVVVHLSPPFSSFPLFTLQKGPKVVMVDR